MKNRSLRAFLLVLTSGLLLFPAALAPRSATASSPSSGAQGQVTGDLTVHFLNVGQGDAIYIECPTKEHRMLIDSGDLFAFRYPGSPGLFRDQFQQLVTNTATHINLAVASHPHSDHIGSMQWVLEHYPVDMYIDNGQDYTSATSRDLVAKATALSAQGGLVYQHAKDIANPMQDADFCPASNVNTVLLVPNGFGLDNNPNNNSVVVRLNYNDQSFLFTGDAEDTEEQLLLADSITKPLLKSTVLKAPHHGSDTSSSAPFLAAVDPRFIVVSVGARNTGSNMGYRHPRASTIQRFLTYTAWGGNNDLRILDAYRTSPAGWITLQINQGLYVTSVDDTVTLVSDGTNIWKTVDSTPSPAAQIRYTYSKSASSTVYHVEDCAIANQITPANRVTASVPPAGRQLHKGCPW